MENFNNPPKPMGDISEEGEFGKSLEKGMIKGFGKQAGHSSEEIQKRVEERKEKESQKFNPDNLSQGELF